MLQTPRERIRQRRAQMLIHSYLYYQMDTPIVSDHQWQHWADELRDLQVQHPGPIGFYDEAFADWNGSSGFQLPQDDWVSFKAIQVRTIENKLAIAARAPVAARQAPPPAPPPPPRAAPAQAAQAAQFSLF